MAATATPWVEGLTIGAALRRTAQAFPTNDALVFLQDGTRLSYEAFDRAADAVALSLIALGFERGDHFGVWASNWPEWVLLQFGAARAGVVLVTVNPSYRASEAKYALAQSEVRGLALIDQFKSLNFYDIINEICPELKSASPGALASEALPNLKAVVAMRGAAPAGMLAWDELLKAGETIDRRELEQREAALDASDPINLQYTSGTTGFPKGALLSHRNLLLNAYYAGENQRFSADDRLCIPVPLYHCFGCVLGTLTSTVFGAAMVFPHESFRPDTTLDALERERCTAVYGVPTMFIAQLEHESYRRRDLGALRTGIMAGSPCPIELMKRVTENMGAEEITIGYGQTEASPLITQTRFDDPIELRVGTVGRALPGIEVQVFDPATGQAVGDDVSGELCARGHCVMLGYYNMPERTAEAIDSEGWLHTGDLACRTPDAYYRITGRIKDTIIRGGENISPREIEERLYAHPKVEDVQVVGVPSRKYGEEVLAFVKLRTGQSAEADEIRDFCAQSLAHFKVPKYILFVDGFPTTVTGKIQKFKLREQAIHQLGLEDEARIETA